MPKWEYLLLDGPYGLEETRRNPEGRVLGHERTYRVTTSEGFVEKIVLSQNKWRIRSGVELNIEFELLNPLGRDGWELVSTIFDGDVLQRSYIFKRPLP